MTSSLWRRTLPGLRPSRAWGLWRSLGFVQVRLRPRRIRPGGPEIPTGLLQANRRLAGLGGGELEGAPAETLQTHNARMNLRPGSLPPPSSRDVPLTSMSRHRQLDRSVGKVPGDIARTLLWANFLSEDLAFTRKGQSEHNFSCWRAIRLPLDAVIASAADE